MKDAKLLLDVADTTEESSYELARDYYPVENTSEGPHHWYNADAKKLYFITKSQSYTSPLYVTDANGENTTLICDNANVTSITPIKNGLAYLAEVESADDTLYTCIDGKTTKIADNIFRFGANKNSEGIYFMRRNDDILNKPYAIFSALADGSNAPKIVCEDVAEYASIKFGTTRDTVLYLAINDENADDRTYSVMMSENGSEPKALVSDCGNILFEVYDDTFFYEKFTKDKYDNTLWHAAYFDGSKSTDITESSLRTEDSTPDATDRKNHTYFFFNGSADDPANPQTSFNVYNCIYKGKYIGDVHTHSDSISPSVFMSDSEFVHDSKDANDNIILEAFKLSSDTPATGTVIAMDPFAIRFVENENAVYYMTGPTEDTFSRDVSPATLMRYKNGKTEVIAENLFSRLTRVYDDTARLSPLRERTATPLCSTVTARKRK